MPVGIYYPPLIQPQTGLRFVPPPSGAPPPSDAPPIPGIANTLSIILATWQPRSSVPMWTAYLLSTPQIDNPPFIDVARRAELLSHILTAWQPPAPLPAYLLYHLRADLPAVVNDPPFGARHDTLAAILEGWIPGPPQPQRGLPSPSTLPPPVVLAAPWRFDDLSIGNAVVDWVLEVPSLSAALAADASNDRKVYVNTADNTLVYHIGANRYKIAGTSF